MVEVLEFRKRIKDALSVYRGSWVELGRLLNECACGGDYKDWGYDDFATYCARELGLKKATIQKLMVSYSYMKRHAVEKLQDIESGKDVVAPALRHAGTGAEQIRQGWRAQDDQVRAVRLAEGGVGDA